ncbi:unnamed protein product [Nyctereutes procyonoides]|uniref:(raccoon dog) hypothetical protein n=1 Tax=Nyctereutes procyonoides TaxID=34880 RepID=A0A811YHP4_NYCPR|nr:unnamed protein product [Nyctereutes procyonoides]
MGRGGAAGTAAPRGGAGARCEVRGAGLAGRGARLPPPPMAPGARDGLGARVRTGRGLGGVRGLLPARGLEQVRTRSQGAGRTRGRGSRGPQAPPRPRPRAGSAPRVGKTVGVQGSALAPRQRSLKELSSYKASK